MKANIVKENSPTTTTSSVPSSAMYTRDWRTALRSPPTYRLGNRTFRFNYHFALLFIGCVSLALLFFSFRTGSTSTSDVSWLNRRSSNANDYYNSTYPLTGPLLLRGTQTFRIGLIADLDTASHVKLPIGDSQIWRSYFKKGFLSYTPSKEHISIKWDDTEPIAIDSSYSLKGRGMELSELVTFNGKLLTFDDRTGLVYELTDRKAIPWVILLDGDGHTSKGFKSEWATVKDKTLYVGSMGKEWTTSQGDFENENPMFVKAVSPSGEVRNIDWSFNYKTIREESLGITWPGYMIHESGMWSDTHKKWFFLPRRCSKEKYNETQDEHMGCNVLISSDDGFSKINTVQISNTQPTHGFSSFKFIPNTDDKIIVALKSEEVNGKTATFITAFTIDGKVILDEQKVPTEYKYEGLEFI